MLKAPLDLIPMALCGLATIVGVAVILVGSDLLRRGVLHAIAYFEATRERRAVATNARRRSVARGGDEPPDDSDAAAITG